MNENNYDGSSPLENAHMSPDELEEARLACHSMCRDQYFIHYGEVVDTFLSFEKNNIHVAGCFDKDKSENSMIHRRMVIDWLRKISNENQYKCEILSYGIFLLDCYVKKSNIEFSCLAATACYCLANDMRDMDEISLETFVECSNGKCSVGKLTAKELHDYKKQVASILKFDMICVNTFDYIHPLSRLSDLNENDLDILKETAAHIYMRSIHCCFISEFRPCIVASACLLSCMVSDYAHLPHVIEEYIQILTTMMNFTEEELRVCCKHLVVCMDKGDPVENDLGCDQEIVEYLPTCGAASH